MSNSSLFWPVREVKFPTSARSDQPTAPQRELRTTCEAHSLEASVHRKAGNSLAAEQPGLCSHCQQRGFSLWLRTEMPQAVWHGQNKQPNKKTKDWDVITGLQGTSPSSTPYHHISKGLFTTVPFTQYILTSYQENITSYIKRQKT